MRDGIGPAATGCGRRTTASGAIAAACFRGVGTKNAPVNESSFGSVWENDGTNTNHRIKPNETEGIVYRDRFSVGCIKTFCNIAAVSPFFLSIIHKLIILY
mmetsp:Transcript_10100/g.23694  ORF Transcript_10100/g.23694 Transcript_10100/m.23694 type:complete len:101 (-) Transcript_10100:19-321(-)